MESYLNNTVSIQGAKTAMFLMIIRELKVSGRERHNLFLLLAV